MAGSLLASRLPVVVRFPAGPRVSLKTVDPPKGNGLGQKKRVIASFWIVWTLWVLMPERLALCDLGAPGWGEPWFPHSAVLLLLLTDLEYGDVCVWVPFFMLVLPPYQFYGWYNVITLLSVTDVAELASRSLCLVLFVCVWSLFCWFAVFFVWFLRHTRVTADWAVYWSCVSSTFAAHLGWRHCINKMN